MTTYRVTPRGNGWAVRDGRGTRSTHRKKRTAKQAAKRYASTGDTIITHRADGTTQSSKRVR